MSDEILRLINTKSINKENISFNLIRQMGCRDLGIRNQLNYGRTIPASHDQLDQYLYTYGPMIESQWENLLSWVEPLEGDIEIIDYACGQGLATLLLFDKFRLSRGQVKTINLIEPSNVALMRAEGVLACCCPDAVIKTTCKKLDDIDKGDLDTGNDSTKIHLFSNILDVEGFNILEAINKTPLGMKGSGSHLILAVSHDRTHNGGSQRVQDIYDVFNAENNREKVSIRESKIDRFTCDNGMSAIAFFINLERI